MGTFTAKLNLFKPNGAAGGDFIDVAAGINDNMDKIEAAAGPLLKDGWLTYVPTWDSAGTQPVLGNGSITGRYKMLGDKTVTFYLKLVMGSTTTYGNSAFQLSLPIAPDPSIYTTESIVGNAQVGNAAVGRYSRMAVMATAIKFILFGDNNNIVTFNSPVWAAGAQITVMGTYQIT